MILIFSKHKVKFVAALIGWAVLFFVLPMAGGGRWFESNCAYQDVSIVISGSGTGRGAKSPEQ